MASLDQQMKCFFKKTRKGQIKKVVKEHYVRDDIASEPDGGWGEGGCIVIDTNVALHQMDFLDVATTDGALRNMIVLQTVLEEVKHRNLSVYKRLKAMVQTGGRNVFVFANEHHADTYSAPLPGESPNDRNDRCIRIAAAWFARQLQGAHQVDLVTNDRECRSRALEQGLKCQTLTEWATTNLDKKYLENIAQASLASESSTAAAAGGQDSEDFRYPPHLSAEIIQEGVRAGRLFVGTLHMARDNATEGWVVPQRDSTSSASKDQDTGSGSRDILVSGRMCLNRATELDRVVVEVLPQSEWRAPKNTIAIDIDDEEKDSKDQKTAQAVDPKDMRRTGKVVGIVRRAWRPYCGSIETLQHGRDKHVLFVPVSKQFPKIRIFTRQAAELQTKRILVAIDSWDEKSRFPTGHYVRTLGDIGNIECESQVILIEHDVCVREFAPAVYRCLPKVGPNGEWDVPAEEAAKRVDLRGEEYRVCSIDPPGCKDIDDALHVRPLPPGPDGRPRVEVGVHIADVTHFVDADSPIDVEGKFRGTSVYLVQKRIDMLPSLLTTDLCSLRGNVSRLAFSCVWVLDAHTAETIEVKYHKSVIKSVAAMSYGAAQAIIDDAEDQSALAKDLRLMLKLTQMLRAKRVARGALSLASPEVRFELDSETHDPINVSMYEHKETNGMVEEMMLLANMSVATKIHQHFPSCAMLRRHPAPPPTNFEPLRKVAEALGFSLDSSSNLTLAESLDKMVLPGNDMANKLIRIMATRSMCQASYFGSGDPGAAGDFSHYGLAAPIYTHFTSPIRRYADVVVHRLLSAAIGLTELPESLRDAAGCQEVADHLNHRHRMAQFAGRASTDLHSHVFFKDRVAEEEAYVMRVRKNGLVVIIPRLGLECPVLFDAAKGYKLDKDGMGLKSPSGPSIRVLDRVQVRIEVQTSVAHRSNLKLTLLEVFGGVYSSATQDRACGDADAFLAGKPAGGGDTGKRASEGGGEKGAKKPKSGKGQK